MKDATVVTQSVSQEILSIAPDRMAEFVRGRLNERGLSSIVTALNKELMFGSPQQREDAGKALELLGFSSD